MTLMIALACALALVSLGGGLYEFFVVDPFWPRKPDLIQPDRGGISRRRFWIPAHIAFELFLIVSLVAAWSHTEVRTWLLVALASHADAPQPVATAARPGDLRRDARRFCRGGPLVSSETQPARIALG
jgi:hypothetical protein